MVITRLFTSWNGFWMIRLRTVVKLKLPAFWYDGSEFLRTSQSIIDCNLQSDNLTKKERQKPVLYVQKTSRGQNFDISALADIIRNCNVFLADLNLAYAWSKWWVSYLIVRESGIKLI